MGLNISSEIKEQIKALIVIELLLEYINQLATETILLQNIVKICKKEKHPQYNPSNQLDYDYALLTLCESVTFSKVSIDF